jgi:hypothetical protein
MLKPVIIRPMISPGTVGQNRNSRPAAMSEATAMSRIRLRPCQSDTCPARNRLAATPSA